MGYWLVKAVLAPILRLLFRPYVTGAQNLPLEGAAILAGNHTTFLDNFMIPLVVPRKVTFLAKSDYFTGGGLVGAPRRVFFRTMGAVPVHRNEQHDAQASLDTALQVLRRGWAFGIYPEGTRSRDGRLYRGRTGVGWLALTSGAPVVPVALIGTDRVQPVDARYPSVHPVRVRFGPPIDPGAYAGVTSPGQARRLLTDDVMDAVAALSGQERAPGYNQRVPST